MLVNSYKSEYFFIYNKLTIFQKIIMVKLIRVFISVNYLLINFSNVGENYEKNN